MIVLYNIYSLYYEIVSWFVYPRLIITFYLWTRQLQVHHMWSMKEIIVLTRYGPGTFRWQASCLTNATASLKDTDINSFKKWSVYLTKCYIIILTLRYAPHLKGCNSANNQSPRKNIFFRYYLSSVGCMYVCMWVCMCVCVSLRLQPHRST